MKPYRKWGADFEVETRLELRYGAFVNSEVNTDDPIGKVVGRRTRVSDPLALGCALNATMNELHRAFGTRVRQRKGVFRFKTWEEVAAWDTANPRS